MASLNQVGYQQLLVGGTPVGLTFTGRPKRALIHVTGAAIRWLAGPGLIPDPTYGFSAGADGWIDWTDPEEEFDGYGLISNARFVSGGNAVLEVGYFG